MKLTTKQLKDRGFDKSYYDRASLVHRVHCSQCVALVIQGRPVHERGCPNAK